MTKVAVLLLAILGCRSSSRFEGVDRDANVAIRSLKPIVRPLLGSGAAQGGPTEIRAACAAGIKQLGSLRDTEFRDFPLAVRQHAPMVREVVVSLIDHSNVICPESSDPATSADCMKWCIERWNTLAGRLDAVSKAASEEGVHIETLNDGSAGAATGR